MTDVIEVVPADGWVARVAALRADGFAFVDFLSAQDESAGDEVRTRVVLRLRRDGDWQSVTIATDVGADLPSLQHVLPGVTWHEREAAEMLGLVLVAPDGAPAGGQIDARPLLLHGPDMSPAPLRKAVLLAARQEREWPGAADPGSNRRRQRPIGVPDERGSLR